MTRTGRPREFDRDDALARARDVFWTRGYDATSVQELVDALGVQRGSLYATFGDKRSLYLQAVELYWRENRKRLEAALAGDPVLPSLRHLLAHPDAVTGAAAWAGQRGCLMGNTAAQLPADDAAARELVAGAYSQFVEVVAAALRRGRSAGEIDDSVAPEVQARLLLVLFQGRALVARASAEPEALDASIGLALDALRRR